MKKMKRYQEGGSTEVEVEKKSSGIDGILPLGLVGQLAAKELLGSDMSGIGLLRNLVDGKRKKKMGEDGSSVSVTIEKEVDKPGMPGDVASYRKGGRIDGCAIRGKTKGTYR
jgi:hypothetical protein